MQGSRNAPPAAGLCLCHGSWSWSHSEHTGVDGFPSSRIWTHSELQHTTLWDQRDTDNSLQHTTSWDQGDADEFTEAQNNYKGHGYFGSGFGPSVNMNPTQRGSLQWSPIDQWELNVTPVLEWHHSAVGWSHSRITSRPMSPSCAPQHSGVPPASHLGLQQRLRTSIGNCS